MENVVLEETVDAAAEAPTETIAEDEVVTITKIDLEMSQNTLAKNRVNVC
jgi:hypothetical protein